MSSASVSLTELQSRCWPELESHLKVCLGKDALPSSVVVSQIQCFEDDWTEGPMFLSRGHLQFLPMRASPTWLLASSKHASREGNRESLLARRKWYSTTIATVNCLETNHRSHSHSRRGHYRRAEYQGLGVVGVHLGTDCLSHEENGIGGHETQAWPIRISHVWLQWLAKSWKRDPTRANRKQWNLLGNPAKICPSLQTDLKLERT